LKLGANYSLAKNWKFGADLVAASDQYLREGETNQNPKISGSTVVNLRLHSAYQIGEQVEVFGLARNLSDEKYETFGIFVDPTQAPSLGLSSPRSVSPAPPRATFAGLRITFRPCRHVRECLRGWSLRMHHRRERRVQGASGRRSIAPPQTGGGRLMFACWRMVATAGCAVAFATATLPAAAAERLRFWNLTTVTLVELYLAPVGTIAWGANQCKNDRDGAVDSDERLTIKDVGPGRYDVKLADKAGRICTVRNVEVKTGRPYAFSISDKDLTNCTK
jgi:hypothetical protein